MIIDCHVHLSTFTNEGLSFARIRDRLLAEMTERGIGYSCILPDSESGSAVSDLDTSLELTNGEPRLVPLGTAHVPALEPAHVEKLETLASARKISGIKLYPGFEPFYPDSPECRPLYDICLRHDIPVVFHSGETMQELWREDYNHPREIGRVAGKLPELKIIIAHFSQPHLEVCRDVILAHPNVHADISGLAHPEVRQVCGKEYIKQILEEVAEREPGKLLFGTDWPICDVGEHIRLVNELRISEATRDLIFSGNAARIFRLELG